jgi:phi LC3 family holin
MINWKVRLKNKYFWITLISALALFGQNIAEMFGISLDFVGIGEQMSSIIEAVFMILALVGIVNDPTTSGITDSSRALSYDRPNED